MTSKGPSYFVLLITDTAVLIVDNDLPDCPTVTNSSEATVKELASTQVLNNRRIIYRDTMGRYDELKHNGGAFMGFNPLSISQQQFYRNITEGKG